MDYPDKPGNDGGGRKKAGVIPAGCVLFSIGGSDGCS